MSDTGNYILDFVSVREILPEDVHFILDSFITCLSRYHESIVGGMTHQYAKKHLESVILQALSCGDYSVFVCSDKNDEHNIFSYIIANTNTNHIFFNYTKYVYRLMGLQKNLLIPLVIDKDKPLTIQWPTKEALKLCKREKATIENQLLDRFIYDN